MGLAVRRSCAAQLGDRDAGWREAEAARPDRGVGSTSHRRSRSGEDRNRRAAAGLRVDRRTRRRRAHGRDTQEPSAGDSHGPLETSGETEWTGNFENLQGRAGSALSGGLGARLRACSSPPLPSADGW